LTEPGIDELAVLRRARQGLSPRREDETRVLAALGGVLATPAGSGNAAPPPEGATASQVAAVRLFRLFAGILALGLAGAAGYGWGYRAGTAAERASAVVAPRVTTTPAASPEREPEREAAAVIEVDKAEPRTKPRLRSAEARTREVAPFPSGMRSPENSGLDEEVRQMRRIERAIRDGNPRLALVLSEELDQAVPQGQLMLERRVATLMASCQLGSDGATGRATDFTQQNPNSSYAERLRQICKLPDNQQRTVPEPGTNETKPGGLP
jgi:hypothetical protein